MQVHAFLLGYGVPSTKEAHRNLMDEVSEQTELLGKLQALTDAMAVGVQSRWHYSPDHLENLAALDTAIRQSAYVYVRSVAAEQAALRVVQNVVLFALLYNRDISCALEDLVNARMRAHQNLHARLIVLTAHECLEKMPHLLGKELRSALIEWETPIELFQAVSDCARRVSEMKRAEGAWINELRHNVIGHRDFLALKQWRLMNNLDIERVEQVGQGLVLWTSHLYNCLTNVFAYQNQLDTTRRMQEGAD